MATIATVLDDTLSDGPVGQVFILSFLLGFDDVT